MRFGLISLFPDMFQSLHYGIVGRALEEQRVQVHLFNPRDYTHDRHRTVDDTPYGGGPGMVMKVEPLRQAIQAAKQALGSESHVVFLSPQGKRLDQARVNELISRDSIVLLAGRYEGIDERLLECDIDEEISIGDYVLSGGEFAAMVLMDAIIRLLPDSLGNEASGQQDSFMNGLLDYPHYTRPQKLGDQKVPDVLLSGDHSAIERWRSKQALGRTWLKRPDLLQNLELSEEQQALLNEFQIEWHKLPYPGRN